MREKRQKQLPLTPADVDHHLAKELRAISNALDGNPMIAELAWQDLTATGTCAAKGAPGMTGDQTVRAAMVKQTYGFTYDELSFHLRDSTTFRNFCLIGMMDDPPSKSALQKNIKTIRPQTWEAINRILVSYAREKGIEKCDKVRIDCTVTETNIHEPDDAAQLWDVVRVLTRLMSQAVAAGCPLDFAKRTLAAKRRRLGVMNAKNQEVRTREYRSLVHITKEVLCFAEAAIVVLLGCKLNAVVKGLSSKMRLFADLGKRVVDQTERRVFEGEKVPSKEKVVSIFEPHTDIIIKDRRDVLFGHKLCLSVGASSMILDITVEDGNPADSELAVEAVRRTIVSTGKVPGQVALDGGFASRENLKNIKELGVKDVCFSKGRGMAVTDMVESTGVYKMLRRFRAGVEGVISFFKRAFDMGRCTWRGLPGFKSYTWASVVACNLLVIARHMIE